jgi:CheY-like chemotaxis protein
MVPTTAVSGTAALAAFEQRQAGGEPYRLVLVDAWMPDMDGFELAAAIKARPQSAAATIMMLSSVDCQAEAARCRELGVARHLIKPIKPSDLLDAILKVLSAEAEAEPEQKDRGQGFPSDLAQLPALRVLLAEDNPVNQKLAIRLLENLGQQVEAVANGKRAVLAALSGRFDLVLIDVQMPEMDGLEATRLIRAHEQNAGGHLPIVALTAHAMKGDRESCLEAGMDEYLSKPIQSVQLAELLVRHAGLARKSELAGRVHDASVNGESRSVPDRGDEPSSRGDWRDVLDWHEMRSVVANDTRLLRDLIALFEGECPRLLADIRAGLESDDGSRVRLAAHALKGAASNFGARPATKAAERLELLARAGDLVGCSSALPVLEDAAVQLMAALAKVMDQHPVA